MRFVIAFLSVVLFLGLVPSAHANGLTEGEYGFCLTGPSARFSDAMDGVAPDFVANNGHWHFEGELPPPGCYVGETYTVTDDHGAVHSFVLPGYFAVDEDTAMKLIHYKFNYCSGDDQFCGKNNRSTQGSNSKSHGSE